jgi:signal transduction histidine kinase
MLDLSKIEAGQLQLEQTDFELLGDRGACASHAADSAQAKGLALRVDAPRHAGVAARRRHPPAPGAAELRQQRRQVHRPGQRVPAVRLLACTDPVALRFEVHDTGVGIHAEQRPCCSAISRRPTCRPAAATAAPAWAWPSPGGWCS